MKELNIARYRIRELERSFNRPFNDQKLLKTIDQHHHHDDNDDDDDDEDVDNHKQH